MKVETPKAKAIFLNAVDRYEASQWPQYLGEACGGDIALRRRVEVLLRAHARSAGLLDALGGDSGHAARPSPTSGGVGTTIGPYKLMEQIGEGGMGTVYVAEQSQPVRRKVALKVIKPGMDTKQVLARFEAERQSLALMDHPNIAKVHDAGATESGRPYFVMELVKGLPITDYCDKARLSIPERLDLFVLVCRAVQHAHQKGIIHRDLKPSNILVTLIDGAAVPKVIDFGIAKSTGGQLTDQTIYTGFAQLIGTPLYMSPEQAELSGVDVDTRSDVYALGVLLYELLTGTTPIDRDTLCKAAYDEIRRVVREQEPPTPSTRLGTLGETLPSVSANRQSNARKLCHAVRGELDWIVMKALEKDRTRRYDTANDFAADVMRHLTNQPVEACPPTVRYRLGKYARRHRTALATVGAFAFLLVATTAVSVGLALWANRQQVRAQEREQMAIDAVRRFGEVIRDTPELKNDSALAKLRATLLKEPQAFFQRLRDRLQADRETTPKSLARLASASFELGSLTDEIGDEQDARRAYKESLAIWAGLVRENPSVTQFQRDLARSHNNIGTLQRATGWPAEALASFEQARSIQERLARENLSVTQFQRDLARSHNNISLLQDQMGRPAEALASCEQARAIRERLARENPSVTQVQSDLATSHNNIGILQRDTGRLAEALASFEQARSIQERLARENPSVTQFQSDLATSHNNIGILQRDTGRLAEALVSYEQARAIRERLAREQPEQPDFASDLGATLNNMALIDLDGRRFDEARDKLARAVEWQRKALAADPDRPTYRKYLAKHLNNLIKAAEGLGRGDEADQARRERAELEAGDPANVALDARLSAVLKGQVPKDNAERIQLALRASAKALHATSARLYAEAIANDPKLGDDRQARHRYNAACAASLAGRVGPVPTGLPVEPALREPPLDEAAKAKLRAQALTWLKAELSAWKRVAMTVAPGNKELLPKTLNHWKQDSDLAGIRDIPELAKLAEAERKEWQALWSEVDVLQAKARSK